MKTKNIVKARGKIVKIKNGGQGYGTITLLIKEGPKESPTVFTLASPMDPEITIGDTVEVRGHIRSTATYTDEIGKRRSDQFFIADSVKPTKTELEMMCKVKGNSYYPDHYCSCGIVGSFIHFHKSADDWGRIYIATASETGRNTRIMLNYYLKGFLLKPDSFTKGDEIALVADINVKFKEYETEDEKKETRKFENLFVEDIVIVNKGDGKTIPTLE